MQIKEDHHGKPKKKNFELPPEEKAVLLSKMKAGAESGNIADIRELGHAYQTGELGVRDDSLAFELTKKAADAGDDKAMVNLAPLYILGIGTNRDYDAAFSWFKKAAEMGNMKAPRYLATHYELGIGTAIDYKAAAHYYEIASERGDITGTCQLGSLYERGLGVIRDYEKAAELYEASAQRGDIIASSGWVALGNLFETRMDGKADYKLAKEWYQKAADAGHPDGFAGLLRMGHYNPHPWSAGHNFSLSILCYVSDLHAAPVYERAIHYAMVEEQTLQEAWNARRKGDKAAEIEALQKAADMGYAPALYEFGRMYREGIRVTQDMVLGEDLISMAEEQGFIPQDLYIE